MTIQPAVGQTSSDVNGGTLFSTPVRRLSSEYRRRFSSFDENDTDSISDLVPSEAVLPKEQGLSEIIHRRISDILLVSNLAWKLYGYLFTGLSWWVQFIRLLLFALFLMPGFSQMMIFYYFSPRVIRSVPYGIQSRNVLDIYLPRRKWRRKGPCPVVIYVTGGAWIIGYKAWGALFARRLSQRGILVFCLDYRNFPQGTITDMVQDCNHGISWVLNNCHLYGGDPNSVYLVGQSAGVHLTLLALIAQSKRHVEGGYPLCSVPSWNPKRLLGYIGVSGAYNLVTLADHLHHRGLYKNIFSTIMSTPDGRNGVMEFSPTLIADSLPSNVVQCIPPVTLFHGTSDKSVPVDNAIQFCQAMKIAGGSCKLHLYHEKTHTQPIVEDPMRGGRDKLMDDVLSVIRHEDCFNQQFPMVPSILIDAATFVCPF